MTATNMCYNFVGFWCSPPKPGLGLELGLKPGLGLELGARARIRARAKPGLGLELGLS